MERTAEVGGDDALFERLYPGLRRWAAATGPSELDPDDLVQEAVAQVLRRHPLTELDDPQAYLRRTIVNLASNHRRGMARWRTAMSRVGRHDDGQEPQYASDLADLLRVPPSDRAVLYLVEVEGATYAEAAETLGISEDAARARGMRARRRLRLDLTTDEES